MKAQALEQRWASVPEPAASMPLRSDLTVWFLGSRDRVFAFLQRQSTAEVLAWLEGRAAAYQPEWPEEKPLRLWYEAALDLIAWQRRLPPAKVLEWLREWDVTATACCACYDC